MHLLIFASSLTEKFKNCQDSPVVPNISNVSFWDGWPIPKYFHKTNIVSVYSEIFFSKKADLLPSLDWLLSKVDQIWSVRRICEEKQVQVIRQLENYICGWWRWQNRPRALLRGWRRLLRGWPPPSMWKHTTEKETELITFWNCQSTLSKLKSWSLYWSVYIIELNDQQ